MTDLMVGDVVKFSRAKDDSDLGRLCYIDTIKATGCVQFDTECLRVGLGALVKVNGDATQCTPECSQGKCP